MLRCILESRKTVLTRTRRLLGRGIVPPGGEICYFEGEVWAKKGGQFQLQKVTMASKAVHLLG
jgi:hypothetical protein